MILTVQECFGFVFLIRSWLGSVESDAFSDRGAEKRFTTHMKTIL